MSYQITAMVKGVRSQVFGWGGGFRILPFENFKEGGWFVADRIEEVKTWLASIGGTDIQVTDATY